MNEMNETQKRERRLGWPMNESQRRAWRFSWFALGVGLVAAVFYLLFGTPSA
jgi:hypothetical protein